MTEKDYSGATTSKIGKNAKSSTSKSSGETLTAKQKTQKQAAQSENANINIEAYRKAGEIGKKTKEFAKNLIKKDMLLSEIAEKIEGEIKKLGGEIAFPVNLSIDDVAAHYTPTLRDEKKASGLLKADIGIHVDGCICDLAFSVDLTPEKKHHKLIEASEKALNSALEIVKKNKDNTTVSQIGEQIEKQIKNTGFTPIVNLSGHSLDEYNIHAGLTIPNINNSSTKILESGAFAIEPFATLSTATGLIYEGAGSNIYHITTNTIQVRDNFAREVLSWIIENKKTLPFSQRELEKEFGARVLIAVSNLKRAGAIEEYPQLIEKSHSPVSQTETSLIILENGSVEILG